MSNAHLVQAARTAQTGSAASRIEASSSPRRAAQRALSIRSPTASSGLASTADNNEFGVVRISRGVHAAIANLWNESVPKRTISSINAHPLLSRALGLLLFNGEQEAATNASGCVESLSPAVADLSLEEVWLRVRSFAAEELPIDTNVLHQVDVLLFEDFMANSNSYILQLCFSYLAPASILQFCCRFAAACFVCLRFPRKRSSQTWGQCFDCR
eukprot:SAG31_NODE_1857_length_7062_cov_6.624587_8_plen_214_part_00